MKLGDSAEVSRAIRARDVHEYAALTQHAACNAQVPEPLVGALFSYLLGVRLPGQGTNYLKQETRFHKVAEVDETLTARVEITRIRAEKHLMDLSTTCINEAGDLIADGRALVSVRDTEQLVTLEVTGSTTVIRLNRPARHNALVPELLVELLDALNDERSQRARTVILAAEGRSFSTGGDLLGFWQHRDNIAEYAQHLVGLLNQVIISIATHRSPVACAVQGQVTGGSLGLLLAADHVIMQNEVQITPWYEEVGFSPDGGWTAMLPQVIGRQRSLDWLSRNESLAAETCLEMGVAHELVATDPLTNAHAWSERVASKDSPLRTDTAALSEGLEAERMAFVKQIQTPEAIDGIARFLGK